MLVYQDVDRHGLAFFDLERGEELFFWATENLLLAFTPEGDLVLRQQYGISWRVQVLEMGTLRRQLGELALDW